jgi:SAM-dependent MidA family methyltransferase
VQHDAAHDRFLDLEWPATDDVLRAAEELSLPGDDYRTELPLHARAFIRSVGESLARGAAFFFDYGFPRREFYHPQRSRGTLMCHYRHRAHGDPYFLPGLQDITSHIDFSAIAQAGREAGMDLLGYTNQAQFLLNCGLTELLSAVPPEDVKAYAPLAAQAQKLVSPAEMGELFKVIALGKGIESTLLGFERGDKSGSL